MDADAGSGRAAWAGSAQPNGLQEAPARDRRGARGAAPFRRVLVGWDSSPYAAAALRSAVCIADGEAAHVVALAVVDGVTHAECSEDRDSEISGRRRAAEEPFTREKAALPAAHAQVSLRIIEGHDPARAVCDYAAEYGFDLLVLGRHGNGGLLHHRLGRVAEAAARKSRVPVLLLSDQ